MLAKTGTVLPGRNVGGVSSVGTEWPGGIGNEQAVERRGHRQAGSCGWFMTRKASTAFSMSSVGPESTACMRIPVRNDEIRIPVAAVTASIVIERASTASIEPGSLRIAGRGHQFAAAAREVEEIGRPDPPCGRESRELTVAVPSEGTSATCRSDWRAACHAPKLTRADAGCATFVARSASSVFRLTSSL